MLASLVETKTMDRWPARSLVEKAHSHHLHSRYSLVRIRALWSSQRRPIKERADPLEKRMNDPNEEYRRLVGHSNDFMILLARSPAAQWARAKVVSSSGAQFSLV